MASEEAIARVKQALWEGANPRGFTGENARAYAEMTAEPEPTPEPETTEVESTDVPEPQPRRRTPRRSRAAKKG